MLYYTTTYNNENTTDIMQHSSKLQQKCQPAINRQINKKKRYVYAKNYQ